MNKLQTNIFKWNTHGNFIIKLIKNKKWTRWNLSYEKMENVCLCFIMLTEILFNFIFTILGECTAWNNNNNMWFNFNIAHYRPKWLEWISCLHWMYESNSVKSRIQCLCYKRMNIFAKLSTYSNELEISNNVLSHWSVRVFKSVYAQHLQASQELRIWKS